MLKLFVPAISITALGATSIFSVSKKLQKIAILLKGLLNRFFAL